MRAIVDRLRRGGGFALLIAVALVAAGCGGGGVEADGEEAGTAAGDSAEATGDDTTEDTAEATAEEGSEATAAEADGEPIRIGMATSLSGSIALLARPTRTARSSPSTN